MKRLGQNFDQASSSDGSSSEEDIPGTPVAASTLRSEQETDEEEDLDGLDLADRRTSSLAELQAAETRSKRCRPTEPTTPEEKKATRAPLEKLLHSSSVRLTLIRPQDD